MTALIILTEIIYEQNKCKNGHKKLRVKTKEFCNSRADGQYRIEGR